MMRLQEFYDTRIEKLARHLDHALLHQDFFDTGTRYLCEILRQRLNDLEKLVRPSDAKLRQAVLNAIHFVNLGNNFARTTSADPIRKIRDHFPQEADLYRKMLRRELRQVDIEPEVWRQYYVHDDDQDHDRYYRPLISDHKLSPNAFFGVESNSFFYRDADWVHLWRTRTPSEDQLLLEPVMLHYVDASPQLLQVRQYHKESVKWLFGFRTVEATERLKLDVPPTPNLSVNDLKQELKRSRWRDTFFRDKYGSVQFFL